MLGQTLEMEINGKAESYEVRYNFLYSQQVASGLTINLGATFVPTKSKNTEMEILQEIIHLDQTLDSATAFN